MSNQRPENSPQTSAETSADEQPTSVLDAVAATPVHEAPAAPRGRHPVNVSHLVMGTAFVLISLIAFGLALGVVDAHDLRWLLPVPWVAAGAAGLAASALRSGRSADRPAPGPDGR